MLNHPSSAPDRCGYFHGQWVSAMKSIECDSDRCMANRHYRESASALAPDAIRAND
jgi:hypothetical protein